MKAVGWYGEYGFGVLNQEAFDEAVENRVIVFDCEECKGDEE